jgi:hypothetical protein
MTPRTARRPGGYDGRTRAGKAFRDGYKRALAGLPMPETARLLSTRYDYEAGFARGAADRAHHDATAAALADLARARSEVA